MVEKVLKYLHEYLMTAEDYRNHVRNFEMGDTVVENHAQGRLTALNFNKETVHHTSHSGQDSEQKFYMMECRKMLQNQLKIALDYQ